MRSEIGLCVRTLFYQEWGKTIINNRLRSQNWWERRLQTLITDPTIIELPIGPEQNIDYPPQDEEFEKLLTKFYNDKN
jgi:hypothetical protein